MSVRIWLPTRAPHTGPDRCMGCDGAGVSGDRFTQAIGTDTRHATLVVDALCPVCEGCGRNSAHLGCPAADHAQWSGPTDDDWDAYERAGTEPCPSCHGRQWYAITGWFGEEPNSMYYLRMPCGCAEPLMVILDEHDQPAGPVPADMRAHT